MLEILVISPYVINTPCCVLYLHQINLEKEKTKKGHINSANCYYSMVTKK